MRSFKDFSPVVIFMYYMSVMLPAMFIMDIRLIGVSVAGGMLIQYIFAGRNVTDSIMLVIICPLVMAIANSLVSHNGKNELFFINGKAITLESVTYGFTTGLMLAAIYIWFKSFNILLTGEQLKRIFGRNVKLGIIVSLVLRLVPEYVKRYRLIRTAALINEQSEDEKSSSMTAMSAALTWALENSMELAENMTLRGMTDTKQAAHAYKGYRQHFKKGDVLLMLVVLALQLMYIMPGGTRMIMYGVLACLPAIYEGKEALRWKVYSLRG